jgi:hypothetical protein
MIDLVQNETKRILINCCSRYAKEKNIGLDKVQIVLGLNQHGNTYTICEEYSPKVEYDIMKVLGVKVDFLGYSKLAPPFIIKSLIRFAEMNSIEFDKVKILCVPVKNENNKNDLELFLYDGFSKYVSEITFKDLFREEDMEMPSM